MVENVLAHARLERNRAGGTIELISVRELLDRCACTLQDRAIQAGMSLKIDCGGLEEARFRADLPAVERILFNLVDNASKYACEAADKSIQLSVHKTGAAVSILVEDHGPGVPRGDRRRLFRPFSRASRRESSARSGIGLGLSLSRRLARKMGGELTLNERDGGGACFDLTLPV